MTTTVAANAQAIFYVGSAQTITFTPAPGGKVFLTIVNPPDVGPHVDPFTAATAVAIPSGSTVYMTAANASATYSDVSSGGGVDEFTALADCPSAYTGHAKQIAHVNAGETALAFTDGVTVDSSATLKQLAVELTDDVGTAGFIASSFTDAGYSDPSSSADLRCGVDGGVPTSYLKLAAYDAGSTSSQFNIEFIADGGNDVTAAAYWRIQKTGLPQVVLDGIPTSDPVFAGALWNDAGTLKISAGA